MTTFPGTWKTLTDSQGHQIQQSAMLYDIEGIKKNCCKVAATVGNAKDGKFAIALKYVPGGQAYHVDYANVVLVKKFADMESAVAAFAAIADEFGEIIAEKTTQAGYRTRAYTGHDAPKC